MPLVAQKQANVWYFGNKSGLDFNFSPPQPITNTGLANSTEGVGIMSDHNGKLLFYTNGQLLINKQHVVMKNGDGLEGDQSSTNNVVIVPLPGNDSLFYLFTTGAAVRLTHDFKYNIINIKGDNGLGEVISKNIAVEDNVFEKIAAVKHCNNRDVWVVIHKWETDEYHSYLVTASGLSTTPVISHTGKIINGYENNEIGTLRFSSDGKKIAALHAFDNDAVELMDFDNTTGVISNPIIFYPNDPGVRASSYIGVYGAEFSPNGKLLYVSASNSNTETAVLYQFDITSNNAITIAASKKIISKNTPWNAGALQMGPDQKIYMAMWKNVALSVIENPDVYGLGCNFVYNKILMLPENKEPVQYGLPTFIQSYFNLTTGPYDFSRTGDCRDKNVSFKLNRLNGIDSVNWDFGDAQHSIVTQPLHNYVNAGFYDVTLIVYKVDCSGLNDTISRRIWIADDAGFLGKDTASCKTLSLSLGVNEIDDAYYLWNTGSVVNNITTTANGLYWLEIGQNGCTVRDSLNIITKPKPLVYIGNDTSICINKQVMLTANSGAIGRTYLWNTGETTPSIIVNKTGSYFVTVTENSCTAADTAMIFPGDCELFIPNAFSPNNDGINDYFGIINSVNVQEFSIKIFNRYGQVIFLSNKITDKWDGTYKGKVVPNGAYTWSIVYINTKGFTKWLKGSVLIVP